MLEANVYDNFNPNYYNISDFTLPNGKKDKRGLPIPKADVKLLTMNCGKRVTFSLHQLH